MISIPFGTVLGLARSRLYANPKSTTTSCDAATSSPFTKAKAKKHTYLSSLLPFVSNNVINVIHVERLQPFFSSVPLFPFLETLEKKEKRKKERENIIGSSGITMKLIRLYCCIRSVVTRDFSGCRIGWRVAACHVCVYTYVYVYTNSRRIQLSRP